MAHIGPPAARGRTTYSIRLITRNFDQPTPLSFITDNGGNYGSKRTSLAGRRYNPDHYFALAILALGHRGSKKAHLCN